MAIVTLAFPARRVPRGRRLRLPGAAGRRPRGQGLDLLLRQVGLGARGRAPRRGRCVVLRCSLGRHREEQTLQRTDEELVELALDDLTDAIGLSVRRSTRTCSGGAVRCRSTPSATSTGSPRSGASWTRLSGLAVCGSAYDGVGHPGLHRLRGRWPLPKVARGPCHNGAMTRNDLGRAPGRHASSTTPSATRCGRCSGCATCSARTPTATPRPARSRSWSPSSRPTTSSSAGVYDLSGLRADADLMVWWHAEEVEQLQDAYQQLRRTAFGRRLEPGLVTGRAAPAGGVQQEPHPGVPGRRGGARLRLRLPVRALLRVVPPRGLRAPPDARRARPDGARVRRRPGQHRGQLRPRRLRVDAGLRGRRAAPHRRPDAPPARLATPAATCARRCPSTPGAGVRRPSWSPRCRRGVTGVHGSLPGRELPRSEP